MSSISRLFFVGLTLIFLYGRCSPDFGEKPGSKVLFPVPVTHDIIGGAETCVQCHEKVSGFTSYHDPNSIGCTPCHRGNPMAAKAEESHQGMIIVPGNLSDLNGTCGATNCHADLSKRVRNSLMTTMSGVVSVNRFVFGKTRTLDTLFHIANLSSDEAADMHLRQLCASCHLGNEKVVSGPIKEDTRGGGCIACHLEYSEAALRSWKEKSNGTVDSFFHPQMNIQVDNSKCFGCHSRSGRISTNYEGWHETKLNIDTMTSLEGKRQLADGRIFRFVQEDVHHAAGLACIDCHSSKEVMGDGTRYSHKEKAVRIQCLDCHFRENRYLASASDLDDEALKLMQLRAWLPTGDPFLVKQEDGEVLINARQDDVTGKKYLKGKISGDIYPLIPPAEICTRGVAHNALSCQACHTSWAPTCIGCHTTYDPMVQSFDHLAKDTVEGKWIEYLGEFLADPPTLGIFIEEAANIERRTVKTFIPGMIMTIDQEAWPGNDGESTLFHRLFSPVSAHTTTRNGRNCKDCHNNPVALGYGRGELAFDPASGRWSFTPYYMDRPEDGLPEDAWIGFLETSPPARSTRSNARPFSLKEQRLILEVGACLTCHNENSQIMNSSLMNFDSLKREMTGDCKTPVWEVR